MAQNPFLILTNESIFKNSEEIRIDMTFAGSRRQKESFFSINSSGNFTLHPSRYTFRISFKYYFLEQSTHYSTF